MVPLAPASTERFTWNPPVPTARERPGVVAGWLSSRSVCAVRGRCPCASPVTSGRDRAAYRHSRAPIRCAAGGVADRASSSPRGRPRGRDRGRERGRGRRQRRERGSGSRRHAPDRSTWNSPSQRPPGDAAGPYSDALVPSGRRQSRALGPSFRVSRGTAPLHVGERRPPTDPTIRTRPGRPSASAAPARVMAAPRTRPTQSRRDGALAMPRPSILVPRGTAPRHGLHERGGRRARAVP